MPDESFGSTHISEEQTLQAFIMDPDLERLEDLLAEFNLFDVLGIARRELQHSAFLAWLLDPRGSHGLRDYFLRHFLTQVAAEARDRGVGEFSPFDVDGWKLDDVDIEVVTERHNIDVLLVDRADEFVCLIENKIGSGEHDDQLSRYLQIVETEYEGLISFPIFLTPDGSDPNLDDDAEHWIPVGYEMVANIIERILWTRRSIISGDVAGFLEQYGENLRRHILDTTGNIDELALRTYDNHRAAIDIIIRAKSNRDTVGRESGWEVIDSGVRQYAPDLERDFGGRDIHRFFSKSLELIEPLLMGEGWTKSGRVLLFEFKYTGGLDLLLYLGPGPQDARERVYDLIQRDGVQGVAMRRANTLRRQWHRLYKKPILSKGDYNPFDPEKAGPKIEQAVKTFYSHDYWPIVNAIRQEFGLEPMSPV